MQRLGAFVLAFAVACSSGASRDAPAPVAAAGAAGSSSGGAAGSSGGAAGQAGGNAGAAGFGGGAAGQAGGNPGAGGAAAGSAGESGAAGSSGAPAVAPLRGAFLQVLNTPGPAFWGSAVDSMAALGMDTAIVQTEAYFNQNNTLNAVDLVQLLAVLDAAANHGMRVWIGLVLPEHGNGNVSAAADPGFISNLVAQSQASADRVYANFGSHPAFAGWYLPVESWTPGAGGIGLLGDYIEQVSAYCRSVADRDIVISPFISDLASDPALTTTTYSAVLGASDVTVVAMQDGVGARSVPIADFGTRVTPYLQAMAQACAATGVAMWVNAESFAGSAPAPWARFLAQLEAAHSVTPHVVTFEYAHFWMGTGPAGPAGQKLHDDYEAWLAAR
jgi:hypothetical protein